MLACRTSHRRVGCRTSGRRVEMSAAAAKSPMQSNALVKDLWGVEAIEGPTEAALADPRRVTAVIYDIGGVMKDVLSVSLSKRLAAIPHVGIRCYGQEIGFSTGVEVRPVTVMEEMMKDTPRVVLDLGRTELSADEVNALVAEMAADKSWSTADAYDIFVHNSNHFGVELAERLVKEPLPSTTFRPVLDISENLLDALPEWRRVLGELCLNSITRSVVVGWDWITNFKKEALSRQHEDQAGGAHARAGGLTRSSTASMCAAHWYDGEEEEEEEGRVVSTKSELTLGDLPLGELPQRSTRAELRVSAQRAEFERIAAMSERIWKKHQAMGPPLNSPFVSPLDSPLDAALPVEDDLTARGRSREAFGGKQAAAGSRALSNRLAAARRTLMNAFEAEHDGANGVPEERVRSVPNGRLQGYPTALEESGEYPLREVASSSVEARGMATSMASIVTLALFMMFSVFSLSFESPAW